jgi:intraflagellar transport protein 81
MPHPLQSTGVIFFCALCFQATSALRKEQENEVMIHERAREHRKHAQEADLRFSDASKRLNEMKNSGVRSQSAEQILGKLQQDVKELNDRKDNIERISMERESHLEKLQSWENADRVTTEEDVHMKRDQVNALEDEVSSLQERLDAQLERNTRLVVFRQASTMALKKFREREDEVEKLMEELRRIQRQSEEKEAEMKAQGKNNAGKMGKRDLKKYGAIVREKIEKYKKMREDLSALRAELVVLQRTEQILKSRHKNLDEFLDKLAAENGVAVSLMVFSCLFVCLLVERRHTSVALVTGVVAHS